MLDVLAFVASLASQFLETAKGPPVSMPLIYKLTNPEPIH